LLLILNQQIQSFSANKVALLLVERVKVLLQDISAEEAVPGVYEDVIAVDVAEPAILLIQVFVYRLAILVDGDWFTAEGVGFLEVVFAGEAVGPAHGHLYFLVNQIDPAFDEHHLFLGCQVVQPFHDEVFLVLEVEGPIIEEPVKQVSYFRLIPSDGQGR